MTTTTDNTQNGTANESTDPCDPSRFQYDLLWAIAKVEADPDQEPYGLAIKRRLEDRYGEEVNHGRKYPNLDELVERGLVEKGEIDKRTNSYELTDAGRTLLRKRAGMLAEAADGELQQADAPKGANWDELGGEN